MRRTAILLGLAVAVSACRGRGDAEADGGTDGDTETGGDGDGSGGDDGVDLEGPCADVLPARRIRRLSQAEYVATLRDLVGAENMPELALASDNVVDGYANDAEALTVSGLLADQYRVAAEAVADSMVADLDAWLPCDPEAMGASACVEAFVVDLGRKAYRRPLAEDEVARYVAMFEELEPEDGFAEGVRWVVAAMLQSPGFLYRTELGEPTDDGLWQLTPHEVAAELSYLVVGTMPDAELATAADDEALADLDALLAHAERLLAEPSAEATLHRFVDAWLRTGQLENVSRDAELFPDLTPEIRAAMRGELERLSADVFENGGTLADLLQADHSFMTDELAAWYGVDPGDEPPDSEGFRRVALEGHHQGLLVRAAILTTHALPSSPSPIHRGVLVRERLLCQELPPPPPGVANAVPDVDPDSTNRERYTQHSEDPSCAGCHELIDPIGFGFEHYDAVGRFRELDNGQPVDASGAIVGGAVDDATFVGAQELAAILAGEDEVTACYAEQWSRFALGGLEQDEGLRCMADEVAAATIAADGRLDAVIAALVTSPGFRVRSDEGGGALPPSSGDDDTTGEPPEPEPDDTSTGEEPPPADPDLEVVVTPNSTWPTGHCDDVTVTNVSDAAVTWEVRLPLEGMLTTVWSAMWVVDGTDTVFTGVDFNMTLAPGLSAMFGYCVETG